MANWIAMSVNPLKSFTVADKGIGTDDVLFCQVRRTRAPSDKFAGHRRVVGDRGCIGTWA
jgi:hypothetical protein